MNSSSPSSPTVPAARVAAVGTSAAPIPAPARPQGAWALNARAWRLYMEHRTAFLLPVVLLELPMLVLSVTTLAVLDPGPQALNLRWITRLTLYSAADSVLTLVDAVLVFGLLALVAVQIAAGFAGRRLDLPAAFRAVLPRLGALLGGSFLLVFSVGVLTMLGITLVVVFSLVLAVINADPNGGGLGGAIARGLANPTQDLWLRLGLVGLLTAAVLVLVVKWSLMVQVVVLEEAPPVDSLRRSWDLVTGAFWRTLAVLLLSTLPLSFLANGTLVAQFFDLVPADTGRVAVLALARGVGLLVRMLLMPWVLALLTLYYYDLRVRRDGRAPGSPG